MLQHRNPVSAWLISGLLQLFLWIGSLILGLVGAYKIIVASSIGKGLSVIQFIKAFGKLGIFTPTNVILAIIALLSGILVYASLSAIVGGLSSTREDVSVNSSYFVILLLISFYVVLFGGVVGDFNPMWMNYVPFVSALILPANLCIGELNIVFGLIAILENLLLVTLFITFASRLYRATIFYKGNRLGIVKAFNMVFSKQK